MEFQTKFSSPFHGLAISYRYAKLTSILILRSTLENENIRLNQYGSKTAGENSPLLSLSQSQLYDSNTLSLVGWLVGWLAGWLSVCLSVCLSV